MSEFDFPNAKLSELAPLVVSHEVDDAEAQYKALFLDLWRAFIAKQSFDVNVSGMAHLGSFEQVQRIVNADGLALLPGANQVELTRYLYRAWMARNHRGRGLHFLRTYLQMLFPNQCEVEQLWQDMHQPYPKATFTLKPSDTWWLPHLGEPGLKVDGSWKLGAKIEGLNEPRQGRIPEGRELFLTSRIRINMTFDVETHNVAALMQIMRNVIPARLVPEFRFWLYQVFDLRTRSQFQLGMTSQADIRYPWCGRVITDHPQGRWQLGRDGEYVQLPQPMGSFGVGEKRGASVQPWRLRSCRAAGQISTQVQGECSLHRVETLALDPVLEYEQVAPPTKLFRRYRKLDGAWQLGGHPKLWQFKLDGNTRLNAQKTEEISQFGSFKIRTHEGQGAPKLVEPKRARLTISGRWRLGGPRNPTFEFFTI